MGASLSRNGPSVTSNAFELSTILRAGPDGLTRVILGCASHERESVLFERFQAELTVRRRWIEFHRRVFGFAPSWNAHAC
jgi:hypothetical protein